MKGYLRTCLVLFAFLFPWLSYGQEPIQLGKHAVVLENNVIKTRSGNALLDLPSGNVIVQFRATPTAQDREELARAWAYR